ncbi:gustatory receptor 5a for trehalose-like [Hyposmocoma kahamanoa]|uniref:gustatory receptor 5a for trehalose-like n=1 Tax=Hyposmocoma kahamanoa TaxID=1477025 RepID=UPI000E6D9F18|nr:gustatory receptor 5a for trehalose-like [Hyposmocoma kahamanoa]
MRVAARARLLSYRSAADPNRLYGRARARSVGGPLPTCSHGTAHLPTRDLKVIGEPASIQRQKPETSFQSAMKVPIMIAQCFGLFPVIGISGNDASKLSRPPSFCEAVMLQKEATDRDRERADPAQWRRTFEVADDWTGGSIRHFKRNFDILLHKDLSRRHHKEIVEPGNEQLQKVESSFQSAMKLPIIIAQCFGLFPVIGFSGTDASKLSTPTHAKAACTLSRLSNEYYYVSAVTVFYFMTTVIGLLFLRMATKWLKLCKHIAKTEAADPLRDKNLPRKCQIACILVLSLAAVEHILSDVSGVAFAMDYQPNSPIYEVYMRQCYSFVWTYIPYNPIIGFLLKIISIQCTFNWNFADAFVMCISFYLTARLQQINDRIIAVQGKYAPSSFYRTVREDYSRIICLIRKIDEDVNGVIFVSYAVNLFIICMQLLHTLE